MNLSHLEFNSNLIFKHEFFNRKMLTYTSKENAKNKLNFNLKKTWKLYI